MEGELVVVSSGARDLMKTEDAGWAQSTAPPEPHQTGFILEPRLLQPLSISSACQRPFQPFPSARAPSLPASLHQTLLLPSAELCRPTRLAEQVLHRAGAAPGPCPHACLLHSDHLCFSVTRTTPSPSAFPLGPHRG